jgi:hypothetical protein
MGIVLILILLARPQGILPGEAGLPAGQSEGQEDRGGRQGEGKV